MKGKYPAYPADPITDVRDLFLKSSAKFADNVALQHKKGGRWIPITYRNLRTSVEEVACGLAALGFQPAATKFAIVGENRPEWAISYLAAACTGIVLVPIDKELQATEVYHILYLSGADALVGDQKHMEMVGEIRNKLPQLKSLVNMDQAREKDGILGFQQLATMGRDRSAAGKNDFQERTVGPEHLLAILFTSGTMGN